MHFSIEVTLGDDLGFPISLETVSYSLAAWTAQGDRGLEHLELLGSFRAFTQS